MLKIIFSFLLISVAGYSWSQLTIQKWHINGEYGKGVRGGESYDLFGISAERIFDNRMGLIYNFEYQSTNNYKQIHGAIGTIAGPPMIVLGLAMAATDENTNTNGVGPLTSLLGALLLILPDGITYHFPIGYHGDIAPYANIIGVDYIWNKSIDYRKWKYAASVGIKASYYFSNQMVVSSYLESRKTLSFPFAFGAGVGLGYSFGAE